MYVRNGIRGMVLNSNGAYLAVYNCQREFMEDFVEILKKHTPVTA